MKKPNARQRGGICYTARHGGCLFEGKREHFKGLAIEPERIKPVTLLFQTGYLTIKGFEQIEANRRYALGFPNLEVENSFLNVPAAFRRRPG